MLKGPVWKRVSASNPSSQEDRPRSTRRAALRLHSIPFVSHPPRAGISPRPGDRRSFLRLVPRCRLQEIDDTLLLHHAENVLEVCRADRRLLEHGAEAGLRRGDRRRTEAVERPGVGTRLARSASNICQIVRSRTSGCGCALAHGPPASMIQENHMSLIVPHGVGGLLDHPRAVAQVDRRETVDRALAVRNSDAASISSEKMMTPFPPATSSKALRRA